MRYDHNVWKLYAIRFFQNLIPAYVIERLFWEQRGMTIQMVVYTEIIYAVTIVLLEIPTGIVADKWGRKRMLILDAFLSGCELVILLFASNFWHFAAAVFLAGIGGSASSGSENALLYDSLIQDGKARHFEKHLGRLNAFDFSAAMLAALSGSFLANRFGFELNYWLSLTSMVISFAITLTLIEPPLRNKVIDSAHSKDAVDMNSADDKDGIEGKATAVDPAALPAAEYMETIESAEFIESEEYIEAAEAPDSPIPVTEYVTASLRFFRKNPAVCNVLLSGMVTGSALVYLDEFWQLYINRLGVPVIYFGFFSAGLMLLRMPGNMLAYVLKSKFSYKALISAVTFVFTAGFLYLSLVKGLSNLVVIFLIFAVSGIIEPLASGYLHHRIDSSMRATIDSFQSLGLRAVSVLLGLGFGYFSTKLEIFGGYGFIAIICGLFLVFFLAAYKEKA